MHRSDSFFTLLVLLAVSSGPTSCVYDFTVDDGSNCTPGDGVARYVTQAPTIDGQREPLWDTTPVHQVTLLVQGAWPQSNVDFSARWWALWDEEALYLFVTVDDDIRVQDSTNAWEDDSIEVFIDAGNEKHHTYDGVNDFQMVFLPGSTNVALGDTTPPLSGHLFQVHDRADGYDFELRLPWASVSKPTAATVCDVVGFDIALDDDDDEGDRDTQLGTFSDLPDLWEHPSAFGNLVLE